MIKNRSCDGRRIENFPVLNKNKVNSYSVSAVESVVSIMEMKITKHLQRKPNVYSFNVHTSKSINEVIQFENQACEKRLTEKLKKFGWSNVGLIPAVDIRNYVMVSLSH